MNAHYFLSDLSELFVFEGFNPALNPTEPVLAFPPVVFLIPAEKGFPQPNLEAINSLANKSPIPIQHNQ